jgi:hypothetical protein
MTKRMTKSVKNNKKMSKNNKNSRNYKNDKKYKNGMGSSISKGYEGNFKPTKKME